MSRSSPPPSGPPQDGPTHPQAKVVLHGGGQRLPVRWVNRADPPMTISRYRVDPGHDVSLHVHTGKAEYWVVLSGTGIVTVGEDRIAVAEGDIVATEPGVPHALHNTGAQPLFFVNVVHATGGAITTTELAGS